MLVSINVELCEDGSGCPLRCIAFDLEWFCLIRHYQDWFFCKTFLHVVEHLLSFFGPNKGLIFLEQLIEGLCQMRESSDKLSIKVSESKPRAYLFHILWDWPFSYSFQFARVHRHFAFFNDKSEVFDPCFAEFAFRRFEVKVVFAKLLKYSFGHFFQSLFGLRVD